MKVVINGKFGGFGLSQEAVAMYRQLTGSDYNDDIRSDPALIRVIEVLGEEANSEYSELVIVEVPDDVEWAIDEYDGAEWIAEKHRVWDAHGCRWNTDEAGVTS